jgi:hypothetical protein
MPSTTYNKIDFNSILLNSDRDHISFPANTFIGARNFSFKYTPDFNIGSGTTSTILTNDNPAQGANAFQISHFSGVLRFQILVGATSYIVTSNSNTWNAGTTYYISVHCNSPGGMSMIVDNVVQSSTNPNTIPVQSHPSSTYMGGNHGYFIRYTRSQIYNFKAWNINKTPAEILAEEDVICDGTEIGLIDCFPFLNETGYTVTGVKGTVGTIGTNNVGGVTYVDNTMRVPYTVITPDPPPTESFDKLQIDDITSQLYPTGRAFNLIDGSYFKRLHNALDFSEATAFEDGKFILNHILPDNDNFSTDDAALWEQRLGLITNTLVSLPDRKLAIQRKMNYPGDIKARQSHDFLEGQLQDAGFSVYVHENIPETSIYDLLITNNLFQLGNVQLGDSSLNALTTNYLPIVEFFQLNESQVGDFQLNSSEYKNKVVNHIDEEKDQFFPIFDNYKPTFFIGGLVKGDFANVSAARKEEFRQLILKIKPVQSVAYLLINYI